MKELEVKANIVGALMEHLNFTQARIKADEILSLIPDYEKGHCKDCCCAKSWVALGITEYTGKSIPEHIEELKDYGSQPNKWGLAAEKRCSFCQETGKMFGNVRVDIVSGLYQSIPCHRCKGAGTITHTLTNDEVGELAKMILDGKAEVNVFCGPDGLPLKTNYILLPSGERVVVEEGR